MMDKNRIKIIITGALIIVFVFAWLNVFRVLKKSSKSNKPEGSQAAVVSMTTPIQATVLISKREWTEDKESFWKRCPFSGMSYSQDESTDLAISGIFWDEAKPRAIINGQIIGEGETIGKFLIEKIEKQEVILFDGEKRIELHM